MVLTGRVALLAAGAGLAVAALSPRWTTLLLVNLALAALVALDVALAASPRALHLRRSGARRTRLGETARVGLTLHHTGQRTLQGTVRDAWTPSAQARLVPAGAAGGQSGGDPAGPGQVPAIGQDDRGRRPDRRDVHLRPGQRRQLETLVTPIRRGDRANDHVAVR